MGRGVSAGGGQSSLGYLFGGGEAPNPPPTTQNRGRATTSDPAPKTAATVSQPAEAPKPTTSDPAPKTAATVSQPAQAPKQVPAGVQSTNANNYVRSDGQNCGNFITERPSTKVHAAPGGGSSLDYLFGGGSK